MSIVSTYVILASVIEDETTLASVNDFFVQNAHKYTSLKNPKGFRSVSDPSGPSGGWSAMQGEVWVAAFNHLDDEAFVSHLRGVPWRDRDAVRVMFLGEHDERWSEVQLFGDVDALSIDEDESPAEPK